MDNNARYLNRLPASHWRAWYDAERRHSALLDEALALGLSVDDAADYAAGRL